MKLSDKKLAKRLIPLLVMIIAILLVRSLTNDWTIVEIEMVDKRRFRDCPVHIWSYIADAGKIFSLSKRKVFSLTSRHHD